MTSTTFHAGDSCKISVVITALDEGQNLQHTVANLESTLPLNSEILVVDDGSSDGSTDFLASSTNGIRLLRSDHGGVAKARNCGAAETDGDCIVFADAHIRLPPNWWRPLVRLLENPKIGAVAPGISDLQNRETAGFGLYLCSPELDADWLDRQRDDPYQVPILPGCCLAMRRDTFDATGGFDNQLRARGGVDNELGVRFWLLGYEMWVVPEVDVGHLFKYTMPDAVSWTNVLHNRLRLAFIHLCSRRMIRVIDELQGYEDFPRALALVMEGDVSTRRDRVMSHRLYDDDWFFRRWAVEW